MSAVNYQGVKTELPRTAKETYSILEKAWLESIQDPRELQLAMKGLAIQWLRVERGWTLDAIGIAFNHPKGHISRILRQTPVNIRKFAESSPDLAEMLRGQVGQDAA